MDLSALAEPEPGRAVSGLTEANVASTRCGLFPPIWLPSQIVRPWPGPGRIAARCAKTAAVNRRANGTP